jgi:predicted HAD superfamily hydrolase
MRDPGRLRMGTQRAWIISNMISASIPKTESVRLDSSVADPAQQLRPEKIASFDVFDTCLTRNLSEPSDAFWLLKRELLKHAPPQVTKLSAAEIYCARLQAAELARSKTAAEEVTLVEIWNAMSELLELPEIADQWQAEIEVEKRLLRPIRATRDIAWQAQNEGRRVIYISDCYLPVNFIEEQLRGYGFPISDRCVYVSSEFRARKETGRLFTKTLEAEGVGPADLVHIGDNPHSDLAVVRRLGIGSRSVPGLGQKCKSLPWVEGKGLPRIVVSGLNKQLHVLRDSRATNPDGLDASALVGQFIGPVLLSFVAWVLTEAEREGIERLYFVSRDCRLASIIGDCLGPSEWGIDCRYLFLSRQAVFLPSASAPVPAEMPWLRSKEERPFLRALLSKLELPWEVIESARPSSEVFAHPDFELTQENHWEQFWSFLAKGSVRDYLDAQIRQRRLAALAYFRHAGLLDGSSWAMVDFGWHGESQRMLTRLLQHENKGARTRGFYLALMSERVLGRWGVLSSLFDQSPVPQGSDEIVFFYVLTHVLGIADHPWVSAYRNADQSPGPLFRDSAVPLEDLKLFHHLQDLIREYASSSRAWARELGDKATARTVVINAFADMANNPTLEMVKPLSSFRTAVNQTNTDYISVVSPLSYKETLVSLFSEKNRKALGLKQPERPWPQGSLAVTRPLRRKAIRASRLLRELIRRMF